MEYILITAKVFTVSLDFLVGKLREYILDESTLRGIFKWLNHPAQRIVYKGSTSGWKEVLSGIPKGSITVQHHHY